MRVYDPDDIVTFYYVVTDGIIKGWTDDKDLVKMYLDFHACKSYQLKKMTCPFSKTVKILNENTHDEIQIHFLDTRDPKNKNKTKLIAVPLTGTEAMFIHDEVQTFMATSINYSYLYSALPYLKKKYRDALKGILLTDISQYSVSGGQVGDLDILAEIQFDQLKVLYRNFPDQF